MMTEKITIYLADDHQIVVDGLRLLIENEENFQVVGSANDGQTAMNEILIKKPDIALLDYRMPGITGLQLVDVLKKKVSTRFIILSMHTDKSHITDAKAKGASAYLKKNAGKSELFECIRKVRNGEQYFPYKKELASVGTKSTLTPRELEILKLVIQEYTSEKIAELLNLTINTVNTHRKNIGRKIGTNTSIGMARYAIENGIEYK
jgi:DNA-binding NarL/FixJ family response regulator